MFRRNITLIIILFLSGLGLSGCAGNSDCTDPSGCMVIYPGDAIVVAAIFPITGEEMTQGNTAYNAVLQAANDKQKLLGHTIKVVKEDIDCSAPPKEEALTELAVNNTITSIIGPFCDQVDEQTFKALSDAGHLQLVFTGATSTASTSVYAPITVSLASQPQSSRPDTSGVSVDVMAYDATQIVFSAIQAVAQTSSGNLLVIPRTEMRDYITTIQNYQGESGTWNCQPDLGCVITPNTAQ